MKFITQLEDVEIIENGVCELIRANTIPSNYVRHRCTATIQTPLLETFSSVYSRIEFDILFYGQIIESLIFTRRFVSPSVPARFRTSRFKDVHRTTVLTRCPLFFHLTT